MIWRVRLALADSTTPLITLNNPYYSPTLLHRTLLPYYTELYSRGLALAGVLVVGHR